MIQPSAASAASPAAAPAAFTTVAARRTLTRPEDSPSHEKPPPSVAIQPKKVDWPRPVREYVQRAFGPDAAIPGIERDEMEKMLKKIITEAAESNSLLRVDWAKQPLPQQIIQFELSKSSKTHEIPGISSPQSNSNTSKKRKSMSDAVVETSVSPRRKINGRNVLEERIAHVNQNHVDRMDKRKRKDPDEIPKKGLSKYQADLEKRKQRFESGKSDNTPPPPWIPPRNSSPDSNDGPVVGTCQDLEKKYFRLTSAPKPETVRPLPILEKTLEYLKIKWKNEGSYSYICDQFKSLRQDLTVQHIKNEFAVNVYEIHARIALEKGDLGEYNQCQTQLRALYCNKLGGHPAEFVAYRILYYIYTCNRTDMNDVLADLTPADKKDPSVKHALGVRSSLALGNYHRFFRLYLDTPNMGAYLIDMFITRERLAALANICKSYRTHVELRFLTEELGFESDQDCYQFMHDHGAQHLIHEQDHERNGKKQAVVVLASKDVGTIFEHAKNKAFRKVDIKGQI